MRFPAARVGLALALSLLVLAGSAPASVGGLTAGGTPPEAPAVAQTAAERPPSPEYVIRINLRPDGDARWNVSATMSLESETDRRAFNRLAEEFERGELEALSSQPFQRAAARASTATGRPMEIQAIEQSSDQANGTGQLSLSFRWTNFTRTQGDTIYLGDAFQTPSGTWLPELRPNQKLIIEFPTDYEVRSSSRRLTNGTIHVTGPAEFEPGQPSAELQPSGGPIPDDRLTASQLVGLVAAAALFTGLVVYTVMRRRGRRAPWHEAEGSASGDGVAGSGESVPQPTDGGGIAGPGVATADDRIDGPGAVGGGQAATAPDGAEGTEEPLLSDEERIERLLDGEGGRMKQVDIVAETGWSNAKVSQLLSTMDEDGRIEKLRIGRENLISLPDESIEES